MNELTPICAVREYLKEQSMRVGDIIYHDFIDLRAVFYVERSPDDATIGWATIGWAKDCKIEVIHCRIRYKFDLHDPNSLQRIHKLIQSEKARM